VDGWTSLSTIMLTIGSAQLMLFGVLGEYVGRLYIESKRRPLYVIDEIATGCSPSLAPNAQSHAGSGAPEARKLHG
jgi:dolichol-phosphate mannosyltransferase